MICTSSSLPRRSQESFLFPSSSPSSLPSNPAMACAMQLVVGLFFSFFLVATPVTPATLDADLAALLDFRAVTSPPGSNSPLASWDRASPSPCTAWRGVTCSGGRVTRVVLEGVGLVGGATEALAPLARLDRLRAISLKYNSLTGAIPPVVGSLVGLRLLFLGGNGLSGSITPALGNLSKLYRLDLSHNNLSGAVPPELGQLERLLTLRLNSNRLSGSLAAVALPSVQEFNVSDNQFTGPIPPSLAGFPPAAFEGNPLLCGAPLPSCRDAVSEPTRPSPSSAAAGAAVAPAHPASEVVVASTPSAKPDAVVAPPRRARLGRGAVVAIVAGDFALIGIVAGLLLCYFCPRSPRGRQLEERGNIVYVASPYGKAATATVATAGCGGGGGGFERGRMVFLPGSDGGKRFELEDLLHASAEMLGKGCFGTAYKAVLDDGTTVAVKRLREAPPSAAGSSAAAKREFERHVETLARLHHPNIVPLISYYYARDEKLLVYEFMPNGSLFALLHANRGGPGRTPLDWSARLRIAAGAARGLAHLHRAKLVHGGVKSANVLVDRSGAARLGDYGLARVFNPPPPPAASAAGYRAPERDWATQRGDVYGFGVVMLEMLTGRVPGGGGAEQPGLPRWVQSVVREEWTAEVFDVELLRYRGIEEEMVTMLQLALSCAAAAPEQRPRMPKVVRAIEEIRAASSAGASEVSGGSVESDEPSMSEGATSASH